MSTEQSTNRLNSLVFIHIPKTAGLSLHHVLVKHFGKTNSIRIGNQEDRAWFLENPPEELKKYCYIAGHISQSEVLNKSINYPSIAIVRNPWERMVSLLRYFRTSNLPAHQNLKFDGFESFAEHYTRTGQFNMQCWHFSGTHKPDDSVEAVAMINRCHMYVAPLEYYGDFLKTLSGLLGTRLENVYINVTPKGKPVTLTNADRRLLEPLIGEDLKLYEYVKENYESLKHSFIESVTR